MASLFHQRCANHPEREAAARCPGCRDYYCRECVTEHDYRVVCAACLAKAAGVGERRSHSGRLVRVFQFLAGLLCSWIIFYAVGQMLIAMPSAFHEGTLWTSGFFDP